MIDKKDKKKFRILLTSGILIALCIFEYLIWQYKKGIIAKDKAMMWCSLIGAVVFFFNTVFSLVFKEAAAKGLTFYEKNTPNLYRLMVFLSVCLFLLSIFGIYYYSR